MHACMHACMHTYIHTHIHTHINLYKQVPKLQGNNIVFATVCWWNPFHPVAHTVPFFHPDDLDHTCAAKDSPSPASSRPAATAGSSQDIGLKWWWVSMRFVLGNHIWNKKSLMSNHHMTKFRKSHSFLIGPWCSRPIFCIYPCTHTYRTPFRETYLFTTVWRLGLWSYGRHGGFRWGTGISFEVQEAHSA